MIKKNISEVACCDKCNCANEQGLMTVRTINGDEEMCADCVLVKAASSDLFIMIVAVTICKFPEGSELAEPPIDGPVGGEG